MKEDSMEFSCQLNDEFFQSLDDAQIQHGDVDATVSIRKAGSDDFALQIGIQGVVTVECDLCLDDMEQPIEGSSTYIVKLGQSSDETDDVITVNENEGILRLGWLIYELIALAVPIKHVHAPGKCNDAMTRKLEELSATRSGDETAEDDINPRWAELGKLKIKD